MKASRQAGASGAKLAPDRDQPPAIGDTPQCGSDMAKGGVGHAARYMRTLPPSDRAWRKVSQLWLGKPCSITAPQRMSTFTPEYALPVAAFFGMASGDRPRTSTPRLAHEKGCWKMRCSTSPDKNRPSA